MRVGAHEGELEVLPGHPGVGGALLGAIDEVGGHGAKLFAVYTQVYHVGAVSAELVGQSVGMLCIGIDTVIVEADTVVAILAAIVVTEGDLISAHIPEQVGLVLVGTLGLGSQQQGGIPWTGRLPFNDPGLVMQQHHILAQGEPGILKGTVGDLTICHIGTVVNIAPIGDRYPFAVKHFPAVIVCVGIELGNLILPIGNIVNTIVIGICA